MKISVIIPTYNEETSILECIETIRNQSQKDVEIIIVDDGSTDTTLQKLKDLKLSNLTILEEKHQGPAIARNLGAMNAKGKILVFIDADMTFDLNFLRNLTEPIVEERTKGTFSKDEFVSNWENIWARFWNINENLPSKRRLPNNYPDHQKVFRAILKSEFDRVGGFSKGGYTDDYTLSKKLGYEAIACSQAIFYHKNPDSLSEVYKQAKWVGKREYKLGALGVVISLIRSSLPVSFVNGVYKSLTIHNFKFFTFKIIYDLGTFVGILEMVFKGNTIK